MTIAETHLIETLDVPNAEVQEGRDSLNIGTKAQPQAYAGNRVAPGDRKSVV